LKVVAVSVSGSWATAHGGTAINKTRSQVTKLLNPFCHSVVIYFLLFRVPDLPVPQNQNSSRQLTVDAQWVNDRILLEVPVQIPIRIDHMDLAEPRADPVMACHVKAPSLVLLQ